MLDGANIECFKFHNYIHKSHDCKYHMESPMGNIECFKSHNYGHIAQECRYNTDKECYKCHNHGKIAHHYRKKMESIMNIGHKNKKVWKKRQVQIWEG